MKRVAQLSIGAVISFISVGAIADFNAGPYVGIHGGVAIPSSINGTDAGRGTQFNTGLDVGAQAGYHMGSLRLEGAFTFLNNSAKIDTGVNLRMTTLMANGYYDFNWSHLVAPFVGVGAGWVHAWTDSNLLTVNTPESNEFAYQAIGGILFHATPHLLVDVDYHWLSWTDGNGAQNLIETSLSYVF